MIKIKLTKKKRKEEKIALFDTQRQILYLPNSVAVAFPFAVFN